ncbi:molybdate ABC transporter substrate-binding protein [Gandjariella thermophila]|uniref:Molybdate-binding protein n=1 Tax=Gandjariella thermophila TaxID=1931992 RepID=A0A4D4JCD0_9PSEU|nr:molybdate ABC transporter substrate-binding protein [Gandjariella thermophila]GDY32029.1 molybdate-binding protein [Gandjariella thermophila]
MSRTWRPLAALAAAVLALAGCGGGPAGPSNSGSGAVTGDVTVFAAASLTESFTELGRRFEAAHPGTSVKFNFGGSSALAQQINNGAPADVFASASPTNMKQVRDAGGVGGQPVTFARNTLQIAVARGDPKHIASLADLTRPDVRLALCAEQVPCGAAAKQAFQAANVTPKPVTLEQDVKATLTKVQLGEVDAALVYRTDVAATKGKVDGVDFAEAAKAVNDYPIATLARAPHAAAARAFVDYVLSPQGREVLGRAGFGAP